METFKYILSVAGAFATFYIMLNIGVILAEWISHL